MSIGQSLNTSLSGLRATQAGLSLIAANVANAQTPGDVRKSMQLTTSTSGDGGTIRVGAVNRELDLYLQRQLRVETAGGAYADLRADFYQRLQGMYGTPGSDSSLESAFNNFTVSLQSLVTSPDSTAARSLALSSAQVLAQTLNGLTSDIQALRGDAESGIADAVISANDALEKIGNLNSQLAVGGIADAADAALMDQRDNYIDQLSELMDIRIVTDDRNQVTIFTNSGMQLVGAGAGAVRLSFVPQGTVSAATLWDADPAKSNLGSLMLVSASGATVDLIATKSIRSGKIAAYIDMRDNVLVQAQNQLDSLAATMAQAVSDDTIDGTAVTGPPSGFSVDTTGWLNGNRLNLTYTETATNTQHRVSIIRVDDPAALPLSNSATVDAGDEVIGVDFSGGLASVVTQLNTLFGTSLQFSNTGTTLQVVDDGVPDTTDVDAFSVTQTATALGNGRVAFSLFTDGGTPFTDAITAVGSQSVGLAARIAVNPALLGDPSRLVLYGTGISNGDATRPNLLYDRLTNASFAFSAQTGLGNANSPYTGSLPGYLRQMLSVQGADAANAANLAHGQDVVVNALKQRFSEASGVNIDQEMTNLIRLQTAYGANARVMSAVRDMIDLLMKI